MSRPAGEALQGGYLPLECAPGGDAPQEQIKFLVGVGFHYKHERPIADREAAGPPR